MPHNIGKALAYALLLWIVGFVWGSVVFMTPALRNIAAIPYVSRYPAISLPLLVLLVLLFKNGLPYFASLTVWLAYSILLTAPCLVGRSLAITNSNQVAD